MTPTDKRQLALVRQERQRIAKELRAAERDYITKAAAAKAARIALTGRSGNR